MCCITCRSAFECYSFEMLLSWQLLQVFQPSMRYIARKSNFHNSIEIRKFIEMTFISNAYTIYMSNKHHIYEYVFKFQATFSRSKAKCFVKTHIQPDWIYVCTLKFSHSYISFFIQIVTNESPIGLHSPRNESIFTLCFPCLAKSQALLLFHIWFYCYWFWIKKSELVYWYSIENPCNLIRLWLNIPNLLWANRYCSEFCWIV